MPSRAQQNDKSIINGRYLTFDIKCPWNQIASSQKWRFRHSEMRGFIIIRNSCSILWLYIVLHISTSHYYATKSSVIRPANYDRICCDSYWQGFNHHEISGDAFAAQEAWIRIAYSGDNHVVLIGRHFITRSAEKAHIGDILCCALAY